MADEPAPRAPDRKPDEPSPYGLIGVIFAVGLVVGAIYLMNRMRHWAELGDCAFTHAPACRELLNK